MSLKFRGGFKGKVYHSPIWIYYEDTDFSGIVYHANYLKYAERGRSDYLAHCGIDYQEMQERDPALAFAITQMNINFHASARISELLEVRTIFTKAVGARLLAEQHIFKDDACIWSATVTAACIDMGGRAKRLPADIIEKIRPYLSAG